MSSNSEQQKQMIDTTFSSEKEVQSFVRNQLGMPGQKAFKRNIQGGFKDLDGNDISEGDSYPRLAQSIIFRSLTNPVDYNGQLLRTIRDQYKTNEVGFFITISFFGAVAWSFARYRRSSLLEQRKRMVFQQYKRQKFLEDSLRLKSKQVFIEEKQAIYQQQGK